jgi:NAD(P)-dependent dehydrogenase (short-subunit alcohol dehydrogenase family)
MKDKIVFITGAGRGIGRVAAIALARQGANLVLTAREAGQVPDLKKDIISNCGHNRVDILTGDLSLMNDVRNITKQFRNRYDRVDVLINNAAIMSGNKRVETAEGIEKTIATNLIAPFLLTAGLFPCLARSADARIINTASSAHWQNARPDFQDIESRKRYSGLKAYGDSKLFLILFTQQLSRRIQQKGLRNITVNSLHPGAVATNFAGNSDLGWFMNLAFRVSQPFFISTRKGADTIIYLASSPEAAGISGKYFYKRKPAKVAAKHNSIENEQAVWKFCEERTDGPFL